MSYDKQHVLLSPDAIDWAVSVNASFHNLQSFDSLSVYSEGFIVCGVGPQQNAFLTYTGDDWSRVDTTHTPSDIVNIFSLEPTLPVWLASESESGKLLFSLDNGTTWNETSTYLTGSLLASVNSPFLISSSLVVYLGTNVTYAPLNLQNIEQQWATYEWNKDFSISIVDATVVGSVFVAVDDAEGSYSSSDAINWSFLERSPPVNGPITSITSFGGNLIAVGLTGSLLQASVSA